MRPGRVLAHGPAMTTSTASLSSGVPSAFTPAQRTEATPAFPLPVRARWSAAAMFVLGGAFQLAAFLLDSPDEAAGPRVSWWLAHDTRIQLAQTFSLLAVPLMLGSFLYAYRLVREQSRRLALVATTLLVTAMIGLGLVMGVEMAARWAAVAGHREAAIAILSTESPGLPGVVGFVMFLGFAALGNVLIAIALWRSHYVPRIVAVLVIVFSLLDFVLGQGVISHALDLVNDCVLGWAFVTGYVRTRSTAVPAGAH